MSSILIIILVMENGAIAQYTKTVTFAFWLFVRIK
jgi:hypothetical protein